MSAIDPELLMRYADDEVSHPERRSVEERLGADPNARDLLATFLEQRARLPAALALAEDEARLSRCECAIDRALGQRRRRQRRADIRRWALPIAASLVITLAGGLLSAHYANRRASTEVARILAAQAHDHQLALETRIEALERVLSGDTLTWTNEGSGATGSITPLRTYRAPDGQWCREFRETTTSPAANEQQLGIACRDGEGTWTPPI